MEDSNMLTEVEAPTQPKEAEPQDSAEGHPVSTDAGKGEQESAGNGNHAGTSQDPDSDLYAYTRDGKFTSEIFKIEVMNLPFRVGFGQLKKRLQSIGLKPVKVKMVDRSGNAFITFRNDEDRDDALAKCEGHQWKGRKWSVKKAAPAADPLVRKRKLQSENDSGPREKQAKDDQSDLSPKERLNQAVTPLYHLPYEQQLQNKQDEIKLFLRKLGRDIQHNNHEMSAYLSIQRVENNGNICPLDAIKPSPQINDYRNKCEFTIGKNPDGIDKTVGFRLGRYNKGNITVVEVDDCVHVPAAMKKVTKALQTYLQETSQYPAYNPEERSGHWRQVTLRTNRHGAIMMMLAFHPQSLSKEEVAAEREKVAEYFRAGDGSQCDITSMYFIVETERISEPKQEEYLFGDKHIEEELLGVRFRISPAAFFQVNTLAAEVLYKTVAEWSCVSDETVLLDVCCGTGTIGLTMAKSVTRTVGIELCQEAVEDAKVNAELNEIKNAQFHCSKAETLLPTFIRGIQGSSIIAVVDPPRGGLHPDVVKAIRKCALIKRVVYVSCNPNGAKHNIVDFTRQESKRLHGPPFRMVRAVAVDMFPHTPHCELVMLLDRDMTVKEATDQAKLKQKEAARAAAADAPVSDTTTPPTEKEGKQCGDTGLSPGDATNIRDKAEASQDETPSGSVAQEAEKPDNEESQQPTMGTDSGTASTMDKDTGDVSTA